MIVLNQSALAQVIKFIPTRAGTANQLILTDEVTEVAQSFYIDCTEESFYQKFSEIVTLEEGRFYDLIIQENQIKTSIDAFASRVVAGSGTYEAESCLYTFLEGFDANTTLILRDKVFCTNQDIDTYSINNSQYVQNSDKIIIYD